VQGCAQQQVQQSSARLYAIDQVGAAKSCTVPKVSLTDGKESDVAMTVGNDGGWCAISVSQSGPQPYAAGLLTARPAHGKVYIHPVGDYTRIDYTPAAGFTGTDTFSVKLLPGSPVIRATVTVTPATAAATPANAPAQKPAAMPPAARPAPKATTPATRSPSRSK
jgi:hypothetical protein